MISEAPDAAPQQQAPSVDFTSGKLQNTGNAFDLALSGRGFFVLRAGDATVYTRGGQFSRDTDGHLVTPEGAILQSSGGDAVIGTGAMQVLADGTVLQDGQPAGKLTIADFSDMRVLQPVGAGAFAAPSGVATDLASPQVRQGMLETSERLDGGRNAVGDGRVAQRGVRTARGAGL